MRVGFSGFSHPHWTYFADEIETRRAAGEPVDVVGLHFDPGDPSDHVAARLGAARFATLAQLLDATEPDVLVVCGIFATRIDAIEAALERDVWVVSDKPAVVDDDGLARLEAACTRTRAGISIAFEKRWYPATMQARAYVAAGAIGELRHVTATGPHRLARPGRPAWFFDDRYGDLLADLPIHDIDLALLFSGARAGELSAWRAPEADGFATACSLWLGLGEGARAAIDANWLWPDSDVGAGRYEMRLTGTEGTLYIDFARPDVELVSGVDVSSVDVSAPLRPAQQFFDARLAGETPEVGSRESLDASRLAVLAGRSASDGGSVLAWSLDTADERDVSRAADAKVSSHTRRRRDDTT